MRRLLVPFVLLLTAAAGVSAPAVHRAYTTDTNRAMATMMSGMHVRPTGDVDRDFVAMMVPHHQGAIDMAVAQIRYGTNPRLKRIAQEIIVEQQGEIAAMRMALGQPLPRSAPVPTGGRPAGR